METIQLLNCSLEEVANKVSEKLLPQLEKMLSENYYRQFSGKEFLTRKETAEFLAISLVCLHDWIKKGIIEPLKMGNRTYFHRPTLVQQLLDSNRRY